MVPQFSVKGARKPLSPDLARLAAEARPALLRRVAGAAVSLPAGSHPVEIAPGVMVVQADGAEGCRVLVQDLEPAGHGLYRTTGRVRGRRVLLVRADLQAYGIVAPYKMLRRLILAGFIRGEAISYRTVQMDLESYFEHERAVRDDPEFWTRNNCANARKLRLGVSGTVFAFGADYERKNGAGQKKRS